MYTIAILRNAEVLEAWEPRGQNLPKRSFYFTAAWGKKWATLPRRQPPEPAWREDMMGVEIEMAERPTWVNDQGEPDPSIDPSVQGRLGGFIETFVRGWPRHRLIRKQGFGMDPPFNRMRYPHSAVVEMRTAETRTFGFFSAPGVFVAHGLELAADTHADKSLYDKWASDVTRLLARIAPSDKDETSDVETLIGECSNG